MTDLNQGFIRRLLPVPELSGTRNDGGSFDRIVVKREPVPSRIGAALPHATADVDSFTVDWSIHSGQQHNNSPGWRRAPAN